MNSKLEKAIDSLSPITTPELLQGAKEFEKNKLADLHRKCETTARVSTRWRIFFGLTLLSLGMSWRQATKYLPTLSSAQSKAALRLGRIASILLSAGVNFDDITKNSATYLAELFRSVPDNEIVSVFIDVQFLSY